MHLFGPDLSERNRQPEWMDEPGLDPELHRAALVGLRRVNAISRTVNHIWRAITRELKKPVDHPLVVGDLACGGGDIAIELAQLAHQAGWPVRVIGYDLSEQALRFARKRAEETALDVSFKSRDLLGAELPAGIDVFYSSLFMHHLSNEDAGRLLASAGRQARQLVVISDLVRSGWGYGLAWWGGAAPQPLAAGS
ncbi:MAG: methyltransferase domain-containing protein [Planctomycetaceae bacterium]